MKGFFFFSFCFALLFVTHLNLDNTMYDPSF